MNIREKYEFEGPGGPNFRFEGKMEIDFRSDVPLPDDLKAFRETLYEACLKDLTLTFEMDGKSYSGIRVSSMSRTKEE